MTKTYELTTYLAIESQPLLEQSQIKSQINRSEGAQQMSADQNISYWLAEVQRLQQALGVVRQERDLAYQEATGWRERYEAEAKLRQRETLLASQRVQALEQDNARMKGSGAGAIASEQIEAEVAQLETPEALQERLKSVLGECDRLRQSLYTEQEAHKETRLNLSVALGDAIDLLTKRQG
jgi:hypothetical protein